MMITIFLFLTTHITAFAILFVLGLALKTLRGIIDVIMPDSSEEESFV